MKARDFRFFAKWCSDNLLEESVFSVETWLEVAYHLNKQRWDSGIDWLEKQPISKIKTMITIYQKVVEQQENEMKKSRRKR